MQYTQNLSQQHFGPKLTLQEASFILKLISKRADIKKDVEIKVRAEKLHFNRLATVKLFSRMEPRTRVSCVRQWF